MYFGGTGKAVDLMIYGGLIVLVAVFQPAGLTGLLGRLGGGPRGPRAPVTLADAQSGSG